MYESNRQIRTIIWNITENKIPKSLTTNLKIKLIGVKTKLGNPNYGNGDLEIHGDEGPIIEILITMKQQTAILRIISVNQDNKENKIHCIGWMKVKLLLSQ